MKIWKWTHICRDMNAQFFSAVLEKLISIRWFVALLIQSIHLSGSFQRRKPKLIGVEKKQQNV